MDPCGITRDRARPRPQRAESLPTWPLADDELKEACRQIRGPRPGFEIAMGLAGLKSLASPYGARRHLDQPSHRSRKRRASRSVRALKDAWGRQEGFSTWLRHILRPQNPRLQYIRLRTCMAGVRALEMARGPRDELAKWLRHFLRPQNPHLLCVRLGSCVASVAGWPWKWPGAGERGWRGGCGRFSGPRIPACNVSGSVRVWP